FFLLTPRPPHSPLFPYTTLFRSICPEPPLSSVNGLSRLRPPAASRGSFLPQLRRVCRGDARHRGTEDGHRPLRRHRGLDGPGAADRKSTRLNSSHVSISYAVFCL